ncbi:hypothetical protein Val02_25710 [Virgisporangium aliadipatigenens]|uniref:Uncharacterized protein n=1 Tax=Virgisporangium aliadipatigenens TaxID=741659 RepID=A0A8J4DP86_9ACTN|nr:hypothetical protein [Virgisporangium aliadipatigenens]GIJ45685.1 hypothetical protein Val02_25710 [Virgisporangium aliadipatigenens]
MQPGQNQPEEQGYGGYSAGPAPRPDPGYGDPAPAYGDPSRTYGGTPSAHPSDADQPTHVFDGPPAHDPYAPQGAPPPGGGAGGRFGGGRFSGAGGRLSGVGGRAQTIAKAQFAALRARPPAIGDMLIMGGGAFVFLWSFAPFVSYNDELIASVNSGNGKDIDGSYSAWAAETFMAPLTWWVVLAGIVLVALSVLRYRRGEVRLPGATLTGLQFGLALFVFFVLLGYALSNKDMTFGIDEINEQAEALVDADLSYAWGGVLMLIGALAALAGAVLNHFNVAPRARRDPIGAPLPPEPGPGV